MEKVNSGPVILVLETGSSVCQVGLLSGDELFRRSKSIRSHSQVLLELVDEVLHEAAVERHQLTAIAVNQGPGSFTGLRVGLSVAQGLAFAVDCPVIPVIALEAMAFGLSSRQAQANTSHCFVTIDARMNQVYSAWYAFDGSPETGSVSLVGDITVLAPSDLVVPPSIESNEIPAVGSGLQYLDDYPESVKARFLAASLDEHSADGIDLSLDALTSLAAENYQRQLFVGASDLDACYVRNQVANTPA